MELEPLLSEPSELSSDAPDPPSDDPPELEELSPEELEPSSDEQGSSPRISAHSVKSPIVTKTSPHHPIGPPVTAPSAPCVPNTKFVPSNKPPIQKAAWPYLIFAQLPLELFLASDLPFSSSSVKLSPVGS